MLRRLGARPAAARSPSRATAGGIVAWTLRPRAGTPSSPRSSAPTAGTSRRASTPTARLIYPGHRPRGRRVLRPPARLGYQPVAGRGRAQGRLRARRAWARLDLYLHDFRYPASDAAGASDPPRARPARSSRASRTVAHAARSCSPWSSSRSCSAGSTTASGRSATWSRSRRCRRCCCARSSTSRTSASTSTTASTSSGIVRALWVNLRSGHVVQGGSTLTQQLMKNFFLTDERTPQAQAHRSADGADRRAPLLEGRDPRELPERDLPRAERRAGHLRRLGGVALLLRQGAARAVGRRDGHARRPDQGAQQLLALPRSRARRCAGATTRCR